MSERREMNASRCVNMGERNKQTTRRQQSLVFLLFKRKKKIVEFPTNVP